VLSLWPSYDSKLPFCLECAGYFVDDDLAFGDLIIVTYRRKHDAIRRAGAPRSSWAVRSALSNIGKALRCYAAPPTAPRLDAPLSRCRQSDHVHRMSIAALAARSAFQRCLLLPQRVSRSDVSRGRRTISSENARLGFAAIAFDFQPTETAVDALAYRW
jgi:hypothetical protein